MMCVPHTFRIRSSESLQIQIKVSKWSMEMEFRKGGRTDNTSSPSLRFTTQKNSQTKEEKKVLGLS